MIENKIVLNDITNIIEEKIDWIYFKNKTIMITGMSGFIISYFLHTLVLLNLKKNLNIAIIGIVRNKKKFYEKYPFYEKYNFIEIIEQDVSENIETSKSIDIIIHAASQASPKYYGNDPVGTLSPNVIGTYNLLKDFGNNLESFIFISSGEVYGTVNENEIPTEENIVGKINHFDIRSCYAESKKMGENICLSWNKQFGVPVKIIRPFHTFGPGMPLDDGRVHCDFVKAILENNNIILNSDGKAIRAFCYLSDFTLGLIYVLIYGKNKEAYNIGNPYNETNIIDLANRITSIFPDKCLSVEINKAIISDGYIKSPILKNSPSIDKIKLLGWFPKISLDIGFKKTISSYLNLDYN